MSAKVDLYNTAYSNYELDVYRRVRIETYGEDLGQTSWVTAEESSRIPELLELTPDSFVLEIGTGSGRYALRIAERIGCRILGFDINPHGVRNANQLAQSNNLGSLARFDECDVSKGLGFPDNTFDAAFSNDVMTHIPGRPAVLRELFRVLKPGGRLLFSDGLVIGGILSHEEIAARSSIGYYAFSPPGENERLLQAAGFQLISATDTTKAAAEIARRWREARNRSKNKEELIAAEGQDNFDGLQRFLACAYQLTSEKRLLRVVYLARKQAH